jgi:hypothetical protein
MVSIHPLRRALIAAVTLLGGLRDCEKDVLVWSGYGYGGGGAGRHATGGGAGGSTDPKNSISLPASHGGASATNGDGSISIAIQ